VRLAVPAFAACLLAYAVMSLVGGQNVAAGRLTGSEWLASNWLPGPGLPFFLKDALINTVFTGYAQLGALGPIGLAKSLDPVSSAYVAPLWTLSVEFYGTALVLVLALAYRHSVLVWVLALLAACMVFGRTHGICFIAGHLMAVAIRHGRLPDAGRWTTAALLSAGVFLCVRGEVWQFGPLRAACSAEWLPMLPCTVNPQKLIGAHLFFFGLATSAGIRSALLARPLLEMGRVSFAVYLVHWPMVFGLASLLLVSAEPVIGLQAARLAAIVFAVIASVAMARLFTRVDDTAAVLGRRVRTGLAGGM
jgi:peptidoglycan/LPS O-acetylase OafA/YrhL